MAEHADTISDDRGVELQIAQPVPVDDADEGSRRFLSRETVDVSRDDDIKIEEDRCPHEVPQPFL